MCVCMSGVVVVGVLVGVMSGEVGEMWVWVAAGAQSLELTNSTSLISCDVHSLVEERCAVVDVRRNDRPSA